MSRSVSKGPFVAGYLIKKVLKAKESGNMHMIIKIYTRRSMITPECVGVKFGVYNGKDFIPVLVKENMVGRKFGEFSPTRKFTGHAADKKAKRN
jgi:small subunit ribosomal protein S19